MPTGRSDGDIGEAALVSAWSVQSTGQVWLPGDDLQAAVFLVAVVQRHPGGHTGARLHPQVELILVQRLAARARRLEVQHRLHRVWLAAQQRVRHAFSRASSSQSMLAASRRCICIRRGNFMSGSLSFAPTLDTSPSD